MRPIIGDADHSGRSGAGTLTDVLALPAERLWQGALFATLPVLIGFLIAVTQTTPVSAQDAARTRVLEAELALMSSYGLLDPALLR